MIPVATTTHNGHRFTTRHYTMACVASHIRRCMGVPMVNTVTVTCPAGATITWDDALNSDENHRAAAEAFAKKWGWDRFGTMHTGVLPNGDHCHVITR